MEIDYIDKKKALLKRKLLRIGNSFGVYIPKAVAESLQIKEGSTIFIGVYTSTLPGGTI